MRMLRPGLTKNFWKYEGCGKVWAIAAAERRNKKKKERRIILIPIFCRPLTRAQIDLVQSPPACAGGYDSFARKRACVVIRTGSLRLDPAALPCAPGRSRTASRRKRRTRTRV